jgi:hypothetical protein
MPTVPVHGGQDDAHLLIHGQADWEIPAGAATIDFAVAEAAFFLRLEEDAIFITTMLEVIEEMELRYATLPTIPDLDLMDQPMLDRTIVTTLTSKDSVAIPVKDSGAIPATLDENNNVI